MNIYEVYYQSFQQRFMVLAPSIADIKDGFWVNKHNEFTKGSDCYKWVPPAQVVMVIKREQDSSDIVTIDQTAIVCLADENDTGC